MKRICRLTVTIAAAFFCMTMILGTPMTSKGADRETNRVQTTVKMLHDQLKITTAQEEQWNKVAQVMQENAATMEPLISPRARVARRARTLLLAGTILRLSASRLLCPSPPTGICSAAAAEH